MEEVQNSGKNQQFLLGLFAGIAVISIIGLIVLGIAYVGKNQPANNGTDKAAVQQGTQAPAGQQAAGPVTETPTAPGVTTFSVKKAATVCKEGGKPVIYLFSTTWCPHCQWVAATFDKTVQEYVKAGKIVAYHWEVDTGDNTLTSDKETKIPDSAMAVYNEFNPQGSIPTYVLGCKYFRVGNGHESQNDLNAEAAELKAAIDDLIK